MERVTVVGASLAGLTAARTLRAGGFDGTLRIVDGQPHRPYDRPPLSKQVLQGTWDVDRIALADAEPDAGLDLEWHLGRRAVALDVARRSVQLDDGRELEGDAVVLACGAVARHLPGTAGIAGIHVLRTLDDALAVRDALDAGAARVVVVGAGFIGGEVAASCRARGVAVTLVEVAATPLERQLGARVGGMVAELHRRHGVDVRLGVGVEAFEVGPSGGAGGPDVVHAVRLGDGTTVPADLVVVGVGVVPDTGWLEGSGLTLDDGVVCDEALRAAPGIVAAGDVARWPSRRAGGLTRIEHWEHALASGEAAARRLLHDAGRSAPTEDLDPSSGGDGGGDSADPAPFDPVPWFWSDQYDRKLQLVGRGGPDHDLAVVVGSLEDHRFVALYGRDGCVTGVLGMNRPAHVVRLRPLVVDGADWTTAVAETREAS